MKKNPKKHHQSINIITEKLFDVIIILYGILVFIHLSVTLILGLKFEYVAADIAVILVFIFIKYLFSKNYPINFINWSFALLSQPILILFFILFDGSNGPQGILVLTSVFLLVSIDPKNRFLPFLFLTSLTVIFCLWIEYNYSNLLYSFPNKHYELFNFGFISITVGAIVTFAIKYTQVRYLEQKIAVVQKNATLNETKTKIEFRKKYLTALKELQTNFLLDKDLYDSYQNILKYFLWESSSSFGLIAAIDNEIDTGFRLISLKQKEWTHILSELYNQNADEWVKINQLHGLLKKCIQSKCFVSAKFNSSLDKHKVFDQFYAFIPVVRNQEFIGFVFLLRSQYIYNETDTDFIELFNSVFATIIQHEKLKRKQELFEKQLKQSKQNAEDKLQVKTQFLTNISHELRTPLSLIIGPISSLLNNENGSLSFDKIKTSLSLSLDNSHKIRMFLEDISNLSRLSSNQLSINRTTYNFYTFIFQLFNRFKIQTLYRTIDFSLIYKMDKSIDIHFDLRKIENIVSNLLTNAFKFTANNGKVQLSVKAEEKYILVEVIDNGVGIGKVDIDHIFDRFFQTNNKEKSIFSGTGVGLALSQELATLLGFKIKVLSTPNVGSTFYFRLPKSIALAAPQKVVNKSLYKQVQPRLDLVDSSNSFCILIVEDNNDMCLFIQETLSQKYSVITAQNGLEALEIIRKADQSIDLILTDLMMPQMDGFKLIKLLKEKKETADIPILVLTAMQEELVKVEVLESGVNDFLTKPFAVQELLIKVKSILSDKSIQKMLAEEQKLLHAAGTIDQEDNRKSSLLDTIKDFVLENIDDVDFNVDRLADQLNMSKRNLYRFVQEVAGQTPLKLVRDIKLDVAKRYLEDAVFDNLRDVVYASGFNTIRHFRKSYSERFQKDPSDFFES